MEDICMKNNCVSNAYAINGGKEVRVIVNAKLINDKESKTLAFDIAKEIEKSLSYPGEIKINVIRELRSVTYAK
jgi:ribonuclease Y